MPTYPLPSILVDPSIQTAIVTFTGANNIVPSAYSDQYGVHSVTLPATITAPTVFYLEGGGPTWTVSGEVNGVQKGGQVITVTRGEQGCATLLFNTPWASILDLQDIGAGNPTTQTVDISNPAQTGGIEIDPTGGTDSTTAFQEILTTFGGVNQTIWVPGSTVLKLSDQVILTTTITSLTSRAAGTALDLGLTSGTGLNPTVQTVKDTTNTAALATGCRLIFSPNATTATVLANGLGTAVVGAGGPFTASSITSLPETGASGYAAAGTFQVATSGTSPALYSYTALTGGNFTGLTLLNSATGTIASGATITQIPSVGDTVVFSQGLTMPNGTILMGQAMRNFEASILRFNSLGDGLIAYNAAGNSLPRRFQGLCLQQINQSNAGSAINVQGCWQTDIFDNCIGSQTGNHAYWQVGIEEGGNIHTHMERNSITLQGTNGLAGVWWSNVASSMATLKANPIDVHVASAPIAGVVIDGASTAPLQISEVDCLVPSNTPAAIIQNCGSGSWTHSDFEDAFGGEAGVVVFKTTPSSVASNRGYPMSSAGGHYTGLEPGATTNWAFKRNQLGYAKIMAPVALSQTVVNLVSEHNTGLSQIKPLYTGLNNTATFKSSQDAGGSGTGIAGYTVTGITNSAGGSTVTFSSNSGIATGNLVFDKTTYSNIPWGVTVASIPGGGTQIVLTASSPTTTIQIGDVLQIGTFPLYDGTWPQNSCRVDGQNDLMKPSGNTEMSMAGLGGPNVSITTSGAETCALPPASVVTPGFPLTINNNSASTANVTLYSFGGSFATGGNLTATPTPLVPGTTVTYESDGTNWQLVYTNRAWNPVVATSTYTANHGDSIHTSHAVTSPAAVEGALVRVKNTSATASIVFTPASGTVDGASTFTLTPLSGFQFECDGTNWSVF